MRRVTLIHDVHELDTLQETFVLVGAGEAEELGTREGARVAVPPLDHLR